MTPARREGLAVGALSLVAFAGAIVGLIARTWELTGYYDHLALVPAIAAWLAWKLWPQLRGEPGSRWGFALLLPGLWVGATGRAEQVLFPQVLGALLALVGLSLLRVGARGTWRLRFPLAFLLLALPFPRGAIDAATGGLRLLVTRAAVELLAWVDVPAVAQGTRILLRAGRVEVDDACSGLQGVLAFVALGALLAREATGAFRGAAVGLAALPAAFLANLARVLLLTALFARWGQVGGLLHTLVGLVAYGVGFALLLGLHALLAPGEPAAEADAPGTPPGAGEGRFVAGTVPALALGAGLALVLPWWAARALPEPASPPLTGAGWRGEVVTLPRPIPGAVYVRYRRDAPPGTVDLYLIRGAGSQLDVHLPSACFPGSGFEPVQERPLALALAPGWEVPAQAEVYRRGGEAYLTVHWYRRAGRDEVAPDFVGLKLRTWLRRLVLRSPEPLALVRLTTPLDADAEARVADLAREFLPGLLVTGDVATPPGPG